jgi:RimJ/RimL family protein N-acetyltransferase
MSREDASAPASHPANWTIRHRCSAPPPALIDNAPAEALRGMGKRPEDRQAKPILRGARIVLRPLTGADADAMYASLDEPISKRLTGTHARYTLEDVRAHCIRIENAEDRWDYGITIAGELIGEVVLNNLDRPNKSASLRIAVWAPSQRNNGYGTEAAALLIDYGFDTLHLNRIELEVYSFNPQAMRVYEKLGFRLEGTRREALIWEGEKVDAHIMSILRSEHASRIGEAEGE